MALASSPDQCAKELAFLLDQQTEVCQMILQLSSRQQKLVEDRKENELLVLLSEKQQLLDKHQALSGQAKPYREQWENVYRDQASPATHAVVERSWNNLRDILDQIIKLEDVSRQTLQEHKGVVSDNISRLQRGKIANKAYGGGMRVPPASRYSDKKG